MMRRKLCRHCKGKLEPGQYIHPKCVVPYAEAEGAKAERKKAKQIRDAEKVERASDRAKKERLKTRSDWMREAQAAVNAYVRERDFGLPCISCGRHHQGEIHAGHYLSRGAHPELALDPRNLAAQCQPCNVHLSGNQINYRKGLIARNGIELVEWLEGPHPALKLTEEQIKAIRDDYRARAAKLKKSRARS